MLNGQKTWASRGAFADWLFGMFRTDPDIASATSGLTFILVPLDTPGVTVRPIAQLDGETGFAEVFFDDVRVPVENRLGDEGRGLEGRDGDRRLRARPDAAQPGALPGDRAPPGRALPRERARAPTRARATTVVRCWMEAEAYALETYRTVSRLLARRQDRRRGEPQQDLLVRARPAHARDRARASSASARELLPEAPGGAATSATGSTATCSRSSGPIYAGTNEIQRNIIAERMLGLPQD